MNVQVSEAAPSFRQYVDFDKTLVGLFLLSIYPGLIRGRGEWRRMLSAATPYATATIVIVIGLALASQFVKFDPKLTALFIPWAVVNLFFTCVTALRESCWSISIT